MTSIEIYRERISTLKTSIEDLKGDRPLIIRNLPGRADLVVRNHTDLHLPFGTVIAGDEDHVYLRVPYGRFYWAASGCDDYEPDGYTLERFLAHLREQTAEGEQFRIVYQPEA